MAEQYQKLVNKQYNSPINLYSDRNVREILERETKVLANGAIGIDFNNPMINKPSNLQNSAVLRMLEEEENRKRSGQPGSLKRVAWPPPNSELDEFIEQEAIHSQGGPLYSTSINTSGLQNYQTPSVQSQPQKPLSSPVVAQRQQQQQDQLLYQQQQLPKSSVTNTNSFQPTISPVTSVKSPQSVSQSSVGQSPFQSAPISPNVSKSPGAPQNQAPAPQRYQLPVKQVEPPPSTITLRPQAPVSQAPPPLVTSQPATATLRGGKNLRGDLKWPPENVRERMAAEEQHLIELSHGPAVRPRKNCKDYSSFFAKHALTHAYPGYKIPPGTQFYDHNPVM